jgi:hypothetical protein
VSVELYERRTRDFVFGCQHSGRSREKIVVKDGAVLRDVDVQAAFRDLTKKVIGEACDKVAAGYLPQPTQGEVVEVAADGSLTVEFAQGAIGIGDMFNVIHPGDKVRGIDGKEIERLWRHYAIARVTARAGKSRYTTTVVATDGTLTPSKGDILRIEGRGKGAAAGKLFRVGGVVAQGSLSPECTYSPSLMTEWLHNGLLGTGAFRLLPPNYRQDDMTRVELALISGDFQRTDAREVVYNGDPKADVLVTGRLGMTKVARDSRVAKIKATLSAGFEVTFTDAATGTVLFTKKLAGENSVDQVIDGGQMTFGADDLTSDLNALTRGLSSRWQRRRPRSSPSVPSDPLGRPRIPYL